MSSLTALEEVVRNVSRMPGQRNVVLVSPGFIAPQMEFEYNNIIDRQFVRKWSSIRSTRAVCIRSILLAISADPPQVAPPPQKGLLVFAAANANDDLLSVWLTARGSCF